MSREEEIKGRLDKATPSPWVATENHVSCPLCDGEGDVDALTLDAVSPWSVTVQVYGIGTDFKNHEAFLHHAPDDIRYLLSRNEELQRRVEKIERVVSIGRKMCSVNDDSTAVLKGNKKVSNKESFLDACAHELGVLEMKLRKEIQALDAADAEEK